jgi:SAM-dependent methyltransferase
MSQGVIDIRSITSNLEERVPGLWSSPAGRPVSYPSGGNRELRDVDEHSFWYLHRNRCIVELVRRFKPDGAIFDVGGGNGTVSRALTQAGFTALVVEPDADGARSAHARGLRPVVCSTVADAGFRAGIAAAVGLFDVIEHIEDDAAFLDSLREVLRPGGRLYISAPAFHALWSFEDEYAGHFRRYTIAELQQTLHRAGYTVDFATYIFSMTPPAVLLFRTLPSVFGVRRHIAPSLEHQPGGRAVARLAARLLAFETAAVRRGIALPFGGSCLVAAHATATPSSARV